MAIRRCASDINTLDRNAVGNVASVNGTNVT